MSISLKSLRYAYPQTPDQRVLDIDHWQLERAGQVFIHGPSGCGKTTLLNLLSGMTSPAEGEISILDTRIDTMSRRERDKFRANHIGYIFQQFNLIPYLDAVDNIKLATQFSDSKTRANSGLEPQGLLQDLNLAEADWRKPASQLSIGQQQRVAIARALVNQPEILIADEPTSSLDQANRNNFMHQLMDIVNKHAITLVFVSHDMTLAQHFERVDALQTINQASRLKQCS